MLLVAAIDVPTREEAGDVIREAEQILIDAVLDNKSHITITPVAPPRTAPREDPTAIPAGSSAGWWHSSTWATRFPWARSPPRRKKLA